MNNNHYNNNNACSSIVGVHIPFMHRKLESLSLDDY